MFEGHGRLHLEGDHLDLSFREPERWPSLTPKGAIRSFTFAIGDPDVGPGVQLGLMTPVEDEKLDWKHSIDPVHHHGSDQFRVVPGGEWDLAGKRMPAGSYAYQEAGWIYQEHPGGDGHAWMALLMADRRGTSATLRRAQDHDTIFAAGEEYGLPLTGDAEYPHPAGSKGIAAIATTEGACQRGYLLGDIDRLGAGQVSSGLLGDPDAGPLVHVVKAGPGESVLPPCTYSTEVVLIVTGGSCTIGADRYHRGDIRVQRADTALPGISSDADGLSAVLIVGNRRAGVPSTLGGALPAWTSDGIRLVAMVSPRPGGPVQRAG